METGKIYYLREYNWCSGTLIKENKKSYTIEWINNTYHGDVKVRQKFPKEKCAFPNELVAIIEETWKGTSGSCGYRVEKELYSEFRIPAKNVYYQCSIKRNSGRLTEYFYGVLPREDYFSYFMKQNPSRSKHKQLNAINSLGWFFARLHRNV